MASTTIRVTENTCRRFRRYCDSRLLHPRAMADKIFNEFLDNAESAKSSGGPLFSDLSGTGSVESDGAIAGKTDPPSDEIHDLSIDDILD
jgi:hypothetical protein